MQDLNALDLPTLFDVLTRRGTAGRLLQLAREEDLNDAGDVTSVSIIDANAEATATLMLREEGVVAGMEALPLLLSVFAADLEVTVAIPDGMVAPGRTALATLRGSHRAILGVERTMLNLVGRLCGVATLTRRYVRAIAGTHAVVCDTRKTTPGMRAFEKYAVRCGGGTLHRSGLWDAVLYKDNHLAGIALDDLAATLNRASRDARANGPLRFIEVEVDSMRQLQRVLACEPGVIDVVLLDNMSTEALQRAVAMRDESGAPILLEASGGVTLESIRSIAETGVDRISVGALTHHAASVDVALDMDGRNNT